MPSSKPLQSETIVYDDFSGGERGSLQDWRSTPTNSYRALNMLVNKAGELMVRPGIINVTPTGMPTGKLLGFGNTPVTNSTGWFIVGDRAYTFNCTNGSNLQVAATHLTATPDMPVAYIEVAGDIYFVSDNAGLYKLTPATSGAPTLTKLSSAPGALAIAQYEDRLILGNIAGSNGNRIRYSDALDFTSWPADNFFDVGNGDIIGGLWWQRDHLLIGKPTGWYTMIGVPGYNASLRRLLQTHNGPVTPADGNLVWQDVLVYWGLGMQSPSMYNASIPKYFTHLNNGGFTADSGAHPTPPAYGIAPLRALDTGFVFLNQSNKAISFINSVWNFHTFTTTVAPFASVQGMDNQVLLTDGGGTSAEAKFYLWSPAFEAPGMEGQPFQKAGDASTTPIVGNVTFPEWWSKWGGEVVVKDVIIDFRKYDTGGSQNNQIDIQVKALRRRRGDGTKSSQTLTWSEDPDVANTSGVLDRFVAGFGDQGAGNGFQIVLSNIKGVAIQRIQVVLEYNRFRGPTASY